MCFRQLVVSLQDSYSHDHTYECFHNSQTKSLDWSCTALAVTPNWVYVYVFGFGLCLDTHHEI